MKHLVCFLFTAFFAIAGASTVSAETLEIYIDADFSHSSDAAVAIEDGVRTALAEVDHQLDGHTIEVVVRDHRGNVKRSHRNMQHFLQNDRALAMIGGLHSPPYLTHRSFMNQNGILTLLPWSAAGPITRADDGEENWIFRLSVDDFRSGDFFVQEAVDKDGCQKLALLLIDTGWGRANEKSIKRALASRQMEPELVAFFPPTLGDASAGTLGRDVARSGADCVIMLANWDDGALVANSLNEHGSDIRLFSHWGITGGKFEEHVTHQTRSNLSLRVLQTCGFRREAAKNAVLEAALAGSSMEAETLSDLNAPTGFVHAYDLTKILIAAVRQAAKTSEWSDGIANKRLALKTALEQLQTPVSGILREYDAPYSPYSPDESFAHEALGLEDLCMARFDSEGRLTDAP